MATRPAPVLDRIKGVRQITVSKSAKQSYRWQTLDATISVTVDLEEGASPQATYTELNAAVDSLLEKEVNEQNENLRVLANANSHE